MKYDLTPCPAPRQGRSDRWKARPCVLRYRAFKDAVRKAKVAIPQPCKVVFWLPMPRSWSKKKRAKMAATPHEQRPDLDNLEKALLDAVFEEDGHIWSVWAEKRWGEAGAIQIDPIFEIDPVNDITKAAA